VASDQRSEFIREHNQ